MSEPDPVVTERRVDTGDGELFVIDAGHGVPIVLLHGWPLDHRMFRDQVGELARSFRVVVPDRRGFGRSTAPPDMRRELADLDRLIEQLGLGTVHLIGVSQGGRVALRYAATRPERLRSLVLQGAVVDGLDVDEPDAEKVPVARYAELAGRGRLDEVVARWLAHPMMALTGDKAEARQWLGRILADYRGADLVRYDPSHYRFDTDVLPAIDAAGLPVLVLTGATETLARKRQARAIVSSIQAAREVLLDAAGHLGNVENPEAFNSAVREFCQRVDSLVA